MSQDDARGAGPAAGNKKLEKTKLIFVEGKDEELFFTAMLKHLGKIDVQVMAFGGKPKLRAALRALTLDPRWPDLEVLLVARDADYPPPGPRSPRQRPPGGA